MKKPVIFFSHSSRDRESLLPIRNKLLSGTGNTIEVFMSSDGASIPFGRNWLKEIEDAMRKCKLMFVWVTPASLQSRWITFESGCAFARGIRVVPIGFHGVALDSIPPPLSILQGFDVSSAGSLNNIVAVINQEFDLTFPDIFDEPFYAQHIGDVTAEDSPELLRFVESLECAYSAKVRLLASDLEVNIRSGWREIMRQVFADAGVSVSEHGSQMFGTGFRVDGGDESAKVYIDPLALSSTWKLWTEARSRLYEEDVKYTAIEVQLNAEWELPDNASLIGARLLKSDVSFDTEWPHILYGYHNIFFRLNSYYDLLDRETKKSMFLIVPNDNEDPIPLLTLLRLLSDRQIIRPVTT